MRNHVSKRAAWVPLVMLLVGWWVSWPTGQAVAQCTCTPTYVIGSAVTPTPIPDMATAITTYGAGFNSLSSACISVKGTFKVDGGSTWTLNGCTVKMGTSARINVLQASTLNANGSSFLGCGSTWQTVSIAFNCHLNASGCSFEDANRCITLSGKSLSSITGNYFNTSGIGIDISGNHVQSNHTISGNFFYHGVIVGIRIAGANLKIGYNYHYNLNDPGTRGIFIQPSSASIEIAGGFFIQQERGIEVLGARNVWIHGITATGLTGIFAKGCNDSLYITNSSIRTTYNSVDISGHTTSDDLHKDVVIKDCFISTFAQIGVLASQVVGKGGLLIERNDMRPAPDADDLYYMIEVLDCKPIKGNVVRNNKILLLNNDPVNVFPGAILFRGCQDLDAVDGTFSVIRNNYITVDYVYGTFADMQFGITVDKCRRVQVVANEIHGGPFVMDKGIWMSNNPDQVVLCCNWIDSTHQGLQVEGMLSNFHVVRTDFHNHDEALFYDGISTASAPQFHRGNDWSGANTNNWDAYFTGASTLMAQYSRYTVDPAFIPNGLTKVYVNATGATPSDWFTIDPGNEDPCVDASYCGFKPYDLEEEEGGEGHEPDEAAITDNDRWAAKPLEEPALEALHWGAQQDLYAKLTAYPELAAGDEELTTFFAAGQAGNLAKFYVIEHTLSTFYADVIDSAQQVQVLASLTDINASIAAELDCQHYQQDINALRLKGMRGQDWADAEKGLIDEVAIMCPQVAGRAVVDARILQQHYRVPTWNTDCGDALDRQQSTVPAQQQQRISLAPNPAATMTWLRLQHPATLGSSVEVIDLTGQVMLSSDIEIGSYLTQLDLGNLSNGFYFVRVHTGNQPTWQQKIVVLH